jgi:hypothetical protein
MPMEDRSEDRKTMRQPGYYTAVALFVLLIGALGVLAVITAPQRTLFDIFNPAMLFALFLGSSILLSTVNSIIWYDYTSVVQQNMFRRRLEILWADKPAIQYENQLIYIVGKTHRIVVSPSRKGFNEFLDFVIKKIKAHEVATGAAVPINRPDFEYPPTAGQADQNSWVTAISGAVFVALALWSMYAKNPSSLGFVILLWSILFAILGGLELNKKYRAEHRKLAMIQFPDRIAALEAPDADKKGFHLAEYTVLAALVLFLIWLRFYGFSSLAIGV